MLEQVRGNYQEKLEKKKNELCAELKQLAEIEQECGQQLEQLHLSLKEVQNRAEAVRKNMDSMNLCLQVHKEQRPHFFAGKKKKEEYRGRLNELTNQLIKLYDEDIECRRQEKEINENILLRQPSFCNFIEKLREITRHFHIWKRVYIVTISIFEKRVQ